MPQISFHSPIGDLSIAENDNHIVSLDWGWGSIQEETPLLTEAKQQLEAYFDGKLKRFNLDLDPVGTPYQLKIWNTLQTVPYGQTAYYQEIAKIAGGSPRSVGNAAAANPIPILIPCHRIIGKKNLGGYSGGEQTQTKQYLIIMEELFKES